MHRFTEGVSDLSDSLATSTLRRRVPESVARSFEAPPRPKKQESPEDAMPPGRPDGSAPLSVRFCLWTVYLVQHLTIPGFIKATSRAIRRQVVKVLLLYLKVYGFFYAISGGKVSDEEHALRMSECEACPGLVRHKGKLYCEPCGCPKWFMAELHRKNRWKRHYCPEERHSATEYPDFVTVSPSGCGQKAFKVPGGRAYERNQLGRNDD